jgi:hypothetical protein
LNPGSAQDAVMLRGKHNEQQRRSNEERAVDPQRQPVLQEAEIDECHAPGEDRGVRWQERRQDVAGSNAGTDGQHRRPGEPVGPDRQRRHELADDAVAQPSGGAVVRGASRLLVEDAGDFSVGERLDEAHAD